MDHFKILVITATALMLSAPATAQWSAFGSIEPSTPYDEGWIPAAPPAANEQRVYFNVISGSHYPPLGAATPGKPYVNPNLALLGTQIEPFGLEYHMAYLGVWQDCNGDGYIGMIETAAREYSAELLLDETICPPVDGPITRWTTGAYNYNGWVSEFIPIVNNPAVTDARVYNDGASRVWGDFDRPDEHPTYKTCAAFPWPRGTYHSTGGVLNYVDCRVDILGSFNRVVDEIADPAGLRFADVDDARTGTLGQVDIGGDESDENAAVTTVDCSAEPGVSAHSGNTANQTPLGPTVPAAAQNITLSAPTITPGTNSDPSSVTIAGQVNRTVEEWAEDCDTSNDFGHDVYDPVGAGAPEADFNGVDPNNKIQANWNLGTATIPRNAGASGAGGIPNDGGLGTGGTRWVGDSTWATKPGPRTVRADIAASSVGIASAYWLSFYAQVGLNTTSRFILPSVGPGVYGSWACGDAESGIHEGWNCDGSVWYRNPDGSFPNNKDTRAHPGWNYQLRDVDCYDGRVGALGLGVQPAFYGNGACP